MTIQKRQIATGIVSIVAIIFSAFYISSSIIHGLPFGSQTAAVINARAESEKFSQEKKSPGTLFGEVAVFNDLISKKLTNTKVETNATGPHVELKDLLVARKRILSELAEVSPALFLASVLPANVREKIPKELQTNVEKDISETGILGVARTMVSSKSKEKMSEHVYSFIVNQKHEPMYLVGDMDVVSGATVKVVGVRLGDLIVSDTSRVTLVSPAIANAQAVPRSESSVIKSALLAQAIAPRTEAGPAIQEILGTLVLLLDYEDNIANPPKTRAQIEQILFSGQINAFYREQSYGQKTFTGVVRDWHTVPGVCNTDNPFPSNALWDIDLASYVANNNIDLSQYSGIVVLNNCDIGDSYVTAGGSSVGDTVVGNMFQDYRLPVSRFSISSQSFGTYVVHPFPFTDFDYVMSKGWGYNLGLENAAALDCESTVFGGTDVICNELADSNPFDGMGNGSYATHFNSFYKELLGWVPSANRVVITQPGRYTINTFESGLDAGSKKYAKIKVLGSSKTPYYLELRKGLGFDSKLNNSNLSGNQHGLMVNYATPWPGGLSFHIAKARLLDMSPTSQEWFDDVAQSAVLGIGQQFSDPVSGITIGPVISVDSSSVVFDVHMQQPMCERGNPFMDPPFIPQRAFEPGSTAIMYLDYDNGDSPYCPSSNIGLSVSSSFAFPVIIPSPNPVLKAPNDYGQDPGIHKNITIQIPSNIQPNTYRLATVVRNETTGMQTSASTDLIVVLPPHIASTTPTFGPVGTFVTVTGSNFSMSPRIFMLGTDGYTFALGISDGSSMSFEIPSSLDQYQCTNPSCTVPTVPGSYDLLIENMHGMPSTHGAIFTVIP